MKYNMSKTRNLWWQLIRGLCIVTVILVHCAPMMGDPFDSIDNGIFFLFRSLYCFPVAIFFYISGRFSKVPENREEKKVFLKKRMLRLGAPYLSWTTLYIIFWVLCGQRMRLGDIILKYLIGSAAMPFYYLIVLGYFTIIGTCLLDAKKLIVIRNDKTKERRYIVTCIVACMLLESAGYFAALKDIDIQWVKYTPVWACFYLMGIAVGNKVINVRKVEKRNLIGLTLIAYLLIIAEELLLLAIEGSAIAWSQWHITAFVFSFVLIAVIENASGYTPSESNILVKIGDESFGLFLVHCFFISIFASIYNKLDISLPLIIHRILQFTFSLIGSIVLIKVIRLILPEKIYRCWLGL